MTNEDLELRKYLAVELFGDAGEHDIYECEDHWYSHCKICGATGEWHDDSGRTELDDPCGDVRDCVSTWDGMGAVIEAMRNQPLEVRAEFLDYEKSHHVHLCIEVGDVKTESIIGYDGDSEDFVSRMVQEVALSCAACCDAQQKLDAQKAEQ